MPQRLLAAIAIASALLSACGSSPPRSASRSSSLVAAGRQLYNTEGCSDCHSLDGSVVVAPSWKDLYLSRVRLASGKTITATAAYLEQHIIDPNSLTVAGFPGDVMSDAISRDDLTKKPAQVRALVAFIKSLR